MKSANSGGCFTFLMLLLVSSEISGTTDNNKAEKNSTTIQYRLPNVAAPISYEIKLVPVITTKDNFTFHGESKVTLQVNETTSNLTMHSKDLHIDEPFTTLFDSSGVEKKPAQHFYDNATNFFVLQFEQSISPGNYTLAMKFFGKMTNAPEGIYNSSYTNTNGEKVWLAATKFAQLHARRAFPCWDEPNLKATFNLSVKHYPNYTAVSNMPIKNTFLDVDGQQWTNFDVTPRMSTYLLAFVVSDFECLRDENEKFNVCGRKEVLPYLKHSRYVSQRALELLGNYFDYKYNLPKMDQYAVPDATTGATENWGLIIYRESSFAYEPFGNPISGKEFVTLTVVHELVHQWIGNLVTPLMWKYSWIKEGLPTFLQYSIVDKIFPEWRTTDMFVTRVIQDTTFGFDNVDYYKPLEWNNDNPANIRSRFSPQVYYRGAVIFHMLSNILTETTFKKGIVKFVKDHEYGTFTSEDLWKAMQSAYDDDNKDASPPLSVNRIMKAWVEQQGYPILNVTRDYSTGKIVITQEENLENRKSSRWCVPINFATKSNPNFKSTAPTHWLTPEDSSLVIDGVSKDDWIIVNIQQAGYYRVNYDETNWKLIAQYMNTVNYEKIHVRNRAQLINDLSYMVTLKRQNYTTFLELARYLIREDDYPPWLPTFRAIRTLRATMYDQGVDEELKKFVLGLMEKVIKKIGFEDRSKYDWLKQYKSSYESLDSKTKKLVPTEKAVEKMYKSEDFLTRRFRAKFLSFACSLGHKECKDSARSQLRANIENATENPISPDLVSWVNCHGVEGSEEELLKNINGSDIKYVGYLGCSSDKKVLRQYVEKALVGEANATSKQTRVAMGYLREDDPKNLDQALDFFIQNFDRIYDYFEKDQQAEKTSSIAVNAAISLLNDYIFRIRTHDQMKKVSELVEKEQSRMPPSIKESIVKQTSKIQWSEENAAILGEWLHDHPSQTTVAA